MREDRSAKLKLSEVKPQVWVSIPDTAIMDSRLSPETMGVLAQLLLQDRQEPVGTISPAKLASRFKAGTTSAQQVATCMTELEEAGYIKRIVILNADGDVMMENITITAIPFVDTSPLVLDPRLDENEEGVL